jgi:hypothetical protein
LLPGVSRAMVPSSAPINEPGSTYTSPRNTLYSASGVVVALGDDMHSASPPPLQSVGQQPAQPAAASSALPFDEEAKLVFGVIYSLRNMIKKLSGRCAIPDMRPIRLSNRITEATNNSQVIRRQDIGYTYSRQCLVTSLLCSAIQRPRICAWSCAKSMSALSLNMSSATRSCRWTRETVG